MASSPPEPGCLDGLISCVEPGLEGLLVVDVAAGPVGGPRSVERGQPRVEVLRCLAEVGVIRIPEPAHREAGRFEPRGARRGQGGEEGLGVVGRLSLSVSARDDKDMLLLSELTGCEARHVHDGGREPSFAGLLGRALGKHLSGARLGAE